MTRLWTCVLGLKLALVVTAAVAVWAQLAHANPTWPANQASGLWRCSMAENIIAAEIEPLPNQANQAALALQRLGFRIRHIGTTISVEGPQSLWASTFNVGFEPRRKTVIAVEGGEVTYQKALTEHMRIPTELQSLIAEVMFVEPPEFHQTGVK